MVGRKIMAFIGRREGYVTVAYPDGKYYSIAFGHNGSDVKRGQRVNIEQALALFDADLFKFETRLLKSLKIPLEQYEYDALLSAAYNLGNSGIASVVKLLNTVSKSIALDELVKLCRVKAPDDGDLEIPPQFVESAGLKKRRQAERKLFETGDYGDISRIPFWDGNPYKTKMQWMPFPEAT